jgi:hypothetical protein
MSLDTYRKNVSILWALSLPAGRLMLFRTSLNAVQLSQSQVYKRKKFISQSKTAVTFRNGCTWSSARISVSHFLAANLSSGRQHTLNNHTSRDLFEWWMLFNYVWGREFWYNYTDMSKERAASIRVCRYYWSVIYVTFNVSLRLFINYL